MNVVPTQVPLVSICVPTFNGAEFLEEAIRSATDQTFEDLEIVVVDGGSTDDTVAIASSIDDARIRVVSERSPGMVANWNRTVELSRGQYVKFLFQDDLLAPTCVERMVDIFRRYPSIGLVFSPRSVVVEDPDGAYAQGWLEYNEDIHTHLGDLGEVNDGHAIVMHMAADGFESNRIGEPTCVMIERSRFEQVGTFNLRMRQLVDVEMWYRVLYHSDAGFVDERLASFRVHTSAATADNLVSGVGWVDRLWLVEGMLRVAGLAPADAEVFRRLRGHCMRRIVRHEAWRLRHLLRPSIISDNRSLREYIGYRTELTRGGEPELHGTLG
jgi:glycosyltransferase involved in cell wall biosynthesis